MSDEILIKKYDNRRLYCVPQAKYVSLTEIRDILQRGDRIKVVEKSTGKDITKYILMQVLLEDRYELLPLHFYQLVLQSPKGVVEKFFQQLFPWMLDVFSKFQENGNPQNPMGSFSNPWMQNPFANQFQNPWLQAPKADSASTSSNEKQTMDKILARLQELEKKLQSKDS